MLKMIVDIDNFEMSAAEGDDEVNERDGAVNVVTSLVLQAVTSISDVLRAGGGGSACWP